MAKDDNKILTPEDKKREKELQAKEKEEKALIAKMQKEKERKRKLKEKRLKEQRKEEIKRIKTLINLPFKLLLHISLFITMFMLIILFFWLELDIKTALIHMFLIFTAFYFGIGIVMVAAVLMLSEDKKKELEELQRIEKEKEEIEAQRLRDAEEAKLQILERDLAAMKRNDQKSQELLQSNQKETKQIPPIDQTANQNIINEDLDLISTNEEQFTLPEASSSINDDLNQFNFDNELSEEKLSDNISENPENFDYFKEIIK